jgi:hypothetical protein
MGWIWAKYIIYIYGNITIKPLCKNSKIKKIKTYAFLISKLKKNHVHYLKIHIWTKN